MMNLDDTYLVVVLVAVVVVVVIGGCILLFSLLGSAILRKDCRSHVSLGWRYTMNQPQISH